MQRRGAQGRIPERLSVNVGVDVHEARCHDPICGVHHPVSSTNVIANGDHATLGDPDISPPLRSSCPVHDVATTNHDIQHGGLPCSSRLLCHISCATDPDDTPAATWSSAGRRPWDRMPPASRQSPLGCGDRDPPPGQRRPRRERGRRCGVTPGALRSERSGGTKTAPRSKPAAGLAASERNRLLWLLALLLLALFAIDRVGSKGGQAATSPPRVPTGRSVAPAPASHLDPDAPDWRGDGEAVTIAFGGDVHFPSGTNLGDRLAADAASALGPSVPQLLSGANLSMVNLESALTDGTCPQAQPKQYVFVAPATAVTALRGAGVTLITNTNNHGEDCGPAGLQLALQVRQVSAYPIIGIGQNVGAAFRLPTGPRSTARESGSSPRRR